MSARLISGTEAARILGLKDNKAFVEAFVETNQIQPILFYGRKRLLYRRDEVDNLLEINKITISEVKPKPLNLKEYIKVRAQVHSLLFT